MVITLIVKKLCVFVLFYEFHMQLLQKENGEKVAPLEIAKAIVDHIPENSYIKEVVLSYFCKFNKGIVSTFCFLY